MNEHTDTPDDPGNDEGVSLTKVDVEYLTDFERRHTIPSCDFVTIGYDSSYSDDDVSTKRVENPNHRKTTGTGDSPRMRSNLVGKDADGDRYIGLSGSTVRTDKSSGRIGTLLWVAYPAPEPPKTTYRVTFRALARGVPRNVDVDAATEYVVDAYHHDDVEAPPEDERRVEDVPEKPALNNGGVQTRRRALIDVPVVRTFADERFDDVDEMVEHVRSTFGSSSSSWYDTLAYRDELPDADSDANKRDRGMGSPSYVRENTRYMVEDVEVDVVDTHGGEA